MNCGFLPYGRQPLWAPSWIFQVPWSAYIQSSLYQQILLPPGPWNMNRNRIVGWIMSELYPLSVNMAAILDAILKITTFLDADFAG